MKRLLALPLLLAAPPAGAEEIGLCRFDPATMSFAGTPAEQAGCLMQKVTRGGNLRAQPLPEVLRKLLAAPGAPSPAQRDAALAALPEPYGTFARAVADQPVSSTQYGFPLAYFVIHDTSMPFLGDAPFPADLDHDPAINAFRPYVRPEPVAHYFTNRAGQVWAGHELSEGWRATKLESFYVGPAARGRFVHVENGQPRRYAPGSISLGDTLAPEPGFSDAQYRVMAALYVYASARAARWLIPAQHATVDGGIPDAHDDPQNFDVARFAAEIARLIDEPGP